MEPRQHKSAANADAVRDRLVAALGLSLDRAPVPAKSTAELHRLGVLGCTGQAPRVAMRLGGHGHAGVPFTLDKTEWLPSIRPLARDAGRRVVITRPHGFRLSGRILVLSRHYAKTLSRVLARSELRPVRLGKRELDRRYTIHAADHVAAHLVFPPDFVERLLAFQLRFVRREPSVLFDADGMHVVLRVSDSLRLDDMPRFATTAQARRVISGDLRRVLQLFAEVDILHAKADRHTTAETERLRRAHFGDRIDRLAALCAHPQGETGAACTTPTLIRPL